MKRLAFPMGLATLFTLMVLCTGSVDAQGGPSIKEVMARLHKGENPPIAAIKKHLQSEPPNWAEVQKLSHEFATLTATLSSSTPPKGDKASWASLTKGYADTARELDAAAQKKDKTASLAARDKLAAACTNCHKAHRK